MEFSSPPPARAPSDENDVSDSRYDINRGPSKIKRRRLDHSSRQVQAVFTTDDEFGGSDDSLDEEERDYASASDLITGGKGAEDDDAVARRRAFWAAKAAVGATGDYEDST